MITEFLQKLGFLASLAIGPEPLPIEPAASWTYSTQDIQSPEVLAASFAQEFQALDSLPAATAELLPSFVLLLESQATGEDAILFAPSIFEGQFQLWISAGQTWQRLPDLSTAEGRKAWLAKGRLPNLKLSVPSGRQQILMGRYIGKSPMVPSLRIQSMKGYLDSQSSADSLMWLLWGSCFVLAAYQILIWLSARELIYLTYAAFGISTILGHMAMSGELASFFSGKVSGLAGLLSQMSSLSLLFLLEYTKQFLNLKERRPGSFQVIQGLQVYVIFLFIVELRVPSARVAEITSVSLIHLVLTVIAWQQYKSGDRSARNLIPAMLIMGLASALSLVSVGWNLSPALNPTNIASFGSLCQLVLAALALGDRVYLLEVEQAELEAKRQAEQEAHKAEVIELNKQLEVKVEEQTRDIRAMLESTKIGLMSVTEDLKIHKDYAKYLETILDDDTLGGKTFFEVLLANSHLGSDERAKIETALEYSIGEDEILFEANASVFPREIKLKIGEQKKIVDLDWVPIPSQDGNTEKVLISLRDMTETLQLREEADASKRSVVLISELIELGYQRYLKFDKSCGEAWPLIESILQRESQEGFLAQEPIRKIYVTLHTIKGLVRMFKLSAMTDAIHQAEEIVDKKQLLTSEEILALSEALAIAKHRHDEYREAMKPLQRIHEEMQAPLQSISA